LYGWSRQTRDKRHETSDDRRPSSDIGAIRRVVAHRLGVFTFVYWDIRVLAIFGIGRFPTMS
jgi:hypothetical protein